MFPSLFQNLISGKCELVLASLTDNCVNIYGSESARANQAADFRLRPPCQSPPGHAGRGAGHARVGPPGRPALRPPTSDVWGHCRLPREQRGAARGLVLVRAGAAPGAPVLRALAPRRPEGCFPGRPADGGQGPRGGLPVPSGPKAATCVPVSRPLTSRGAGSRAAPPSQPLCVPRAPRDRPGIGAACADQGPHSCPPVRRR